MTIYSEKDIQLLIEKFSNCTLEKAKWTHEAHLIVAIWHHFYFDRETALNLVRQKIKSYNIAVGTPNTTTSGYHETLTQFWMSITGEFIKNKTDLATTCNAFLSSDYNSAALPLLFYTKEILFSKKARRIWVDGDIRFVESFSV